MLLAIDVGNTHTVLGLFDGETLRRHWRILTEQSRTADEYSVVLWNLTRMAGLEAHQIEQVKLTIGQLRPVISWHQHSAAHERFGAGAAVHALQAHHIEAFTWQLSAFEQLHFFRLCSFCLQPAWPRLRESLREVTCRVEAQLSS